MNIYAITAEWEEDNYDNYESYTSQHHEIVGYVTSFEDACIMIKRLDDEQKDRRKNQLANRKSTWEYLAPLKEYDCELLTELLM